MLKQKLATLSSGIGKALLQIKTDLDEKSWKFHFEQWKKSLSGKIERSVFRHPQSNKSKDSDSVENEAKKEIVGLFTASRPESTPLHESTLRVSAKRYRHHAGIAEVYERADDYKKKIEEERDGDKTY